MTRVTGFLSAGRHLIQAPCSALRLVRLAGAAAALVIAEGTGEIHVSHIPRKLDFTTRAQVAAWAAQHGLRVPNSDDG